MQTASSILKQVGATGHSLADSAICVAESAVSDGGMDWLRGEEGHAHFRENCVTLAAYAEVAWEHVSPSSDETPFEYGDCFDFDFIPNWFTLIRHFCPQGIYQVTDNIARSCARILAREDMRRVSRDSVEWDRRHAGRDSVEWDSVVTWALEEKPLILIQ